jgi:4-alpha-glucanotransferase
VQNFAARHRPRIEFFQWAQWEADRQLGEAQARGKAAGMALGLYQDIADASHPGGSMAWSYPDAVIKAVSVGAPPTTSTRSGRPGAPLRFRRAACAPPDTRRSAPRCVPPCAMPTRCASTIL